MDIVDKRVVVTGAASGIGKALATEFKNEKAKDVVLADLNEEVLKVAEELGFSGFVANVGKEEEVKDLISYTSQPSAPSRLQQRFRLQQRCPLPCASSHRTFSRRCRGLPSPQPGTFDHGRRSRPSDRKHR